MHVCGVCMAQAAGEALAAAREGPCGTRRRVVARAWIRICSNAACSAATAKRSISPIRAFSSLTSSSLTRPLALTARRAWRSGAADAARALSTSTSPTAG